MKYLGAITCIAVMVFTSAALPQDKPLSDDASRQQLFELMRHYSGAEKLQAFPQAFSFPDDAQWLKSATGRTPRSGQIFGIDLSHHNSDSCKHPCPVNWAALAKNDVHYAYLKVSQGVGGYDAYFDRYRNGARQLSGAAKIYVGPYHFLSSSGSGAAQAQYFLKVIKDKLATDDMPPTMDLEWDVRVRNGKVVTNGMMKSYKNKNDKRAKEPYDFWEDVSKKDPTKRPDEVLRQSIAWLEAVEKATGRTPIVYTNSAWWDQIIKDRSKISALSKYAIWIADYSDSGRATEKTSAPGNRPWSLWQFTDLGQAPHGALPSRSVDANVFNGSPEDFRKDFGLP